VFKHEFGGCGNRATRLGGRARSTFHFTQQFAGSSTRYPSARLGRGLFQLRAASLLVGSFGRVVVTRLPVSRCAVVYRDRRGWFLSPVCAASARPSSFVHSRSRHPFKRVGGTFTCPPVTSRWSPVDSHFFDLARPVALVATVSRTASVRLCLPRGQTGAFCRPVALVVARSLVTSPQLERARRFVRSLLVTRPRDLLSNGVV
jgi:hypothetical protein